MHPSTTDELVPERLLPDDPVTSTATGQAWSLTMADENAVAELAQALNVPKFVGRLLWSKGLSHVSAARAFLNPDLSQLHDPLLLNGIVPAIERILNAVRNREPILIYGDYDVDGTLATVLLKTAIDRITPKHEASLVRYHIPHRIREGYGVQASVLTEAVASGVRLVISVDTGIRAFAAADEAAALGLDLIVTDHHLPEAYGIPKAVAVINPNQADCDYPEKNLCGAAVAYKLADALLRAATPGAEGLHTVEPAGLKLLQSSLLKLAAIATVADAVPLTGENRVIVALGLQQLREVRQPGLRSLMRLARVSEDGVAPDASAIGFRLAPRINAAGRLDVAADVVRLLLTRDVQEAETLANKLHRLNQERRDIEAAVLAEIEAQLSTESATDDSTPDCHVIDGEDWHRGVIGILASRVVDRTGRPALVITHESGTAHGSGRSVSGFHLLDAITAAHMSHREERNTDLFHRFGGHAHAVGFSLPSSHVPLLRMSMVRLARENRGEFLTEEVLRVDAELPLSEADAVAYQALQCMQPFGNANPEPVFVGRSLRILELRPVKERHLRIRLEAGPGCHVSGMCWSRSFSWPNRVAELGIATGSVIDVAYQMRWSTHPDFGGLEIQICDLQTTGALTFL